MPEGAGDRAEAAPSYSGSVPSSYGMDFVEVRLDPALHGRPLVVKLAAQGDVARFNVQVWKLARGEVGPRAVTPLPETVAKDAAGVHTYAISQVGIGAYDRLALIITRLDAGETLDPVGGYWIVLESDNSQI